MTSRETVEEIAAEYGLVPLPVEGGLFRQTWRGAADDRGRPAGTAILLLVAAEGDLFSAMHRLPIDEVWHFHRGDPLDLLLLAPDGTSLLVTLGPLPGQRVQHVVPSGTWMGAAVTPGGSWSLCGTTMAPGFVASDYEAGDVTDLTGRYPSAAERIRALCR